MIQRPTVALATLVIGIACVAAPAWAAITAADNSANAAYSAVVDGAWKGLNPTAEENPPGTDNGGSGFLAWEFGGGYHQSALSPYGNLNHFIDGVDFPHSTYNDLGPTAFGLTTAYDQYAAAVARRPFALPLSVGSTFSARIDTPSIYDDWTEQAYPFAIISFLDASNQQTFKAETGSSAVYGDFNWRYTDLANSNADIGAIAPTDTSDGSTIALEMTSATGGNFTIDGITIPITFANGAPASVLFVVSSTGSGDNYESVAGLANGQRELFFDDLRISSGADEIPGDFNGDGDVDGDDLVQWKGDFGQNDHSNADGDSDSDGNDLLIWQRNLDVPLATVNASAIPEPAGSLLAATAGLAMAIRRRRFNRRFAFKAT